VPPPEPVPPPPAPEVSVVAPALDIGALRGEWLAREEGTAWYASYAFSDDGSYTAGGYPPYEESGRIALIETRDDRMLLRFSDRSFDVRDDETVQRWVTLSADRAFFTMDGQIYQRSEGGALVARDPDSAEQASEP
jgi:hypothetical protein